MIDVLDDLCWHDPRNPNAAHCTSTGDEPPEPRKNCACDPCFYGRDRLALEVLSLQSRLAAAEARAERAVGMLGEARNAVEMVADGVWLVNEHDRNRRRPLLEAIAALLKEVSHGQQG